MPRHIQANTLVLRIRMEGPPNTPNFTIEKLFAQPERFSIAGAHSPHFKCTHCTAEYALDVKINKVTELKVSFDEILEPTTQENEIGQAIVTAAPAVVVKQEHAIEIFKDNFDGFVTSPEREDSAAEENESTTNMLPIDPRLDPLDPLRGIVFPSGVGKPTFPGSDRLICDLCSATFKRKYTLKRHFDIIHLEKRWPCADCPSTCPRTFPEQSAMLRHKKEMHEKERRSCEVCHKSTVCTKAEYHSHLQRRHPKFRIPGKHSAKSPWKLPVEDFNGMIFPCLYCTNSNEIFSSLNALRTHLKADHGRIYSCSLCPKAWDRKFTLMRHTMMCHDRNMPKCQLCKRMFLRQKNLDAHICPAKKKKSY